MKVCIYVYITIYVYQFTIIQCLKNDSYSRIYCKTEVRRFWVVYYIMFIVTCKKAINFVYSDALKIVGEFKRPLGVYRGKMNRGWNVEVLLAGGGGSN